MARQLITFLLFIHALWFCANTGAGQTQSLSKPVVNQLIICNAVIKGAEKACSFYSQSYLETLGAELIDDNESEDCRQPPHAQDCGLNTPPSLQSATVLIIDVQRGASDYYVATKDAHGTVTVTSQPTPASLAKIVSDVITLDELHRTLRDSLSFKQNSQGDFVNNHNEIIANRTPGKKTANEGTQNSKSGCSSAIAYRVHMDCAGFISGTINSVYEQSNGDYMDQVAASLTRSLANVGIAIYDDDLVVEFADGSRLVLNIIFTGPRPAKSVDMHRSVTSMGSTFEQYFRKNGATGIADNGSTRSSGAEAKALFGRWPQCQTQAQVLKNDLDYLVTTGGRDDGSKYVLAAEYIDNQPNWANSIICETGPALNPPPK